LTVTQYVLAGGCNWDVTIPALLKGGYMDRRKFIAGTMLAAAGVATAHADGRITGNGAMPNAVADDPAKAATETHKFSRMRTITLEEHYVSPAFAAGPGKANNGLGSNGVGAPHFWKMLQDVGPSRLAQMDAAGIDVQILGHIPGIEQVEAKEQVPVVRDTNDFLLETVAKYPTRYAAFASVCTAAPDQAAKELERMMQAGAKGAFISGNTRGRYLDDRFFWPILEAAQHLNAPIYLHPAPPPQPVIDTYYAGFTPDIVFQFSRSGWGWHIDTGVHASRMILGGVFDQFPKLQIIVGHMGEVLPFMMPRMDDKMDPSLTKLKQSISSYLRQNFFYTPSGFNFTQNFFDVMTQMGVEKRIMFATDHPFCSMMEARLFLDALPISPADRELIAHGNAERLFKM
jgi:predicted TIM-barrel fold metal-dependent hydrolase